MAKAYGGIVHDVTKNSLVVEMTATPDQIKAFEELIIPFGITGHCTDRCYCLAKEQNMKVRIFDTTLRDGEQTPGISLSPDQKLSIAKKLDTLGVDAIEAGFPVVSAGELKAAKMIVDEGLSCEVAGLARTNRTDIDAAIDAGLNYVHAFIATSDIHLKHKLNMTRDQALEKAVDAVEYGKSHGLQVEFSAEDATRTDREFLKTVFGAVAKAGADRIDIPDTVGYSTPAYIAEITRDAIDATGTPDKCSLPQ